MADGRFIIRKGAVWRLTVSVLTVAFRAFICGKEKYIMYKKNNSNIYCMHLYYIIIHFFLLFCKKKKLT